MWTIVMAIAALICFLVAFVAGIAGAGLNIDLVTLGFVFLAGWALVRSLPVR